MGMAATDHAGVQPQHAYGRDEFQKLVEARTRGFAGIRPAHRPTLAALQRDTCTWPRFASS
jgi:hypothetical protein